MALLDLDSACKKATFIIYVAVWVAFGLLINDEAKRRRGVSFHPVSAVIVQSFLKLILSTGMFYCKDGSLSTLIKSFHENLRCLLLYAFPAGMYAVYDVLYYVNMRKFGAAKYMLLVEFRMVLLAFAHQLVFQKRLSRYQWISVVLVTLGCIVRSSEDVDFFGSSESSMTRTESALDYAMILIQIFVSCSATVYTEFLLKTKSHIPTNLQNIFMCLNTTAVLFFVLSMRLTGLSLQEALDSESLAALFSVDVFPLIFVMAFGGILTSYFLKILDSVRKVLANGLEIIILSVVASIVYQQPPTPALVLSVVLAVGGTFIYSTRTSNEGRVLPLKASRQDQNHYWKMSSPRRLSLFFLGLCLLLLPLANNLIGLHRYAEHFQYDLSVSDSEKSSGMPAANVTKLGDTVSCGGHRAASCSECAPQGSVAATYCHGECHWYESSNECVQHNFSVSDSEKSSIVAAAKVTKLEDPVSCGSHAAASCAECAPQEGSGAAAYCHGDCRWLEIKNECVPARDRAAAGYFTINEVDVTYLHEVLSVVTEHLKLHEIHYWLCAGTLLGAMRNRPPGQSRWDDDLDIGIRNSDYMRVEKILKQDERLVAWRKSWGGNGYGLASYQSYGSTSIQQFNLDVVPYALIQQEGETTLKWYPYDRETNETFWVGDFFEKDEINETARCSFWDLELQCPKHSVKVLKRHFGNEVMSVARVYSHTTIKHKFIDLDREDRNNHVAFLPALNKKLTQKLLPNLNLVSDDDDEARGV